MIVSMVFVLLWLESLQDAIQSLVPKDIRALVLSVM